MPKMRKRLVISGIVLAMVGGLMFGGCSRGDEIAIGGSTTVQPLSEAWSEEYRAEHPDVTITVQGGGSSSGVKGAAQGTLDIGAASREMKPEEEDEWPELIAHRVAADGVAIVVHPSNDVGDMTLAELRDIFAGGSTEGWTVVNREEGSGTREVYEEKVMQGTEVGADAEFLPSNGAVKQKVASTENAIGYISLGYVDSSVKPLKVDGVECTEKNVMDGSYPVMRYLNYITNGEPEGLVADYMDYCLSSEGQELVAGEGYIPLKKA
jgi:phosphate transport system substrate-binding protein